MGGKQNKEDARVCLAVRQSEGAVPCVFGGIGCGGFYLSNVGGERAVFVRWEDNKKAERGARGNTRG